MAHLTTSQAVELASNLVSGTHTTPSPDFLHAYAEAVIAHYVKSIAPDLPEPYIQVLGLAPTWNLKANPKIVEFDEYYSITQVTDFVLSRDERWHKWYDELECEKEALEQKLRDIT